MSTYFIGDIHGCYNNLRNILDYVKFDPKIDHIFFTGDLVSRGPNSLEVLRLIKNLKNSACTVLGNHDLYLLKTYFDLKYKNKKINPNHDFYSILHAPDVDNLIKWLRHQPILYINKNKKLLMSHAGINPSWNVDQAKLYAKEIENILISNNPYILWNNIIQENSQILDYHINADKLRKIQNHVISFTKMRYVYIDGTLNLEYKNLPELAPRNIYPWFNLSKIITNTNNVDNYCIIFGHWALLHHIKTPSNVYGLDSGCCWGQYLTLLRWEDKKIIRIPCSPPC